MNLSEIQTKLRDIRNNERKINDKQRGIIEGIETSMARYGRITPEQFAAMDNIWNKITNAG